MPELLVRARSEPSPDHGHRPLERPVEELVRLGSIVLDKPAGPSSHQVAAWVRDIFGLDKVGHGGTLDPNVTGVLPIALQDATKALATIKDQDKAYVGIFEFHKPVDRGRLEQALASFTGDIEQMPPSRAAVKRRLRTRRIEALDLLEFDGRRALVDVTCQGGTYVRTLARDVGKHLGVRAHLAELRRTRSAHFTEDQVVNLFDVADAWAEWVEHGRDDWLRQVVRPVEEMLAHVPRIVLRDTAVDAIAHGAPLGLPGVLEVDKRVARGDTVLLTTQKGEAVALAVATTAALEMVTETTGEAARPNKVFMRPGTYPRGWSKDEA